MAEWDVDVYGHPPTAMTDPCNPSSKYRLVKIQHFVKVALSGKHSTEWYIFACVAWYQPHPYQYKLRKPAEVWCQELFEQHGLHSYIALEKIISWCAYCTINTGNENILAVVPVVD